MEFEWKTLYNGIIGMTTLIVGITAAILGWRSAIRAERRAATAAESERLARIEIAKLQSGSQEQVSADVMVSTVLKTTFDRLTELEKSSAAFAEVKDRLYKENEQIRKEKHDALDELHAARLKYELQIQGLKSKVDILERQNRDLVARVAELERCRNTEQGTST